MSPESNQWLDWSAAPLSRRTILRGGLIGTAAFAVAALVGCDDDDDDDDVGDDDAATASPTSTATATGEQATPTPEAQGQAGAGPGQLIQDPNLPFPYQFPEPDNKTPVAGGVLKNQFIGALAALDPALSQSGSTVSPINPVYNRLVEFVNGVEMDPFKIQLQPGLASSWELSSDGLEYVFTLNGGIKYQNVPPVNGRDFTAEDVVFAYDRLSKEGVNQPIFTALEQIDAPDDQTVRIMLSEPDPDFLFPLGSRFTGIFPREIVDDGSIETAAIGTGPMILSRYSTEEGAFYDTNPDYWKGKPWIDGFELPINRDAGTRLAAFRVGQFDYLDRTINDPEGARALLDTNEGVQIQLENLVNGIQGMIAWDLEDPRFSDPRVRQAMSLAIDRDGVIEILWTGVGKALSTLPWPFVFDSEADTDLGPWWRYDPEEAKKLLTAAGAEDLQFELLMATGATTESINTVLQQMLGEVGIQMDLNVVDSTTRTSQWVGRSWTEAISGFGLLGFTANDYYFSQLHSESQLNRARINDPDIDDWATRQRSELDEETRRELLRQIWDRFHDRVYWIQHPNAFVYNIYQPWLRNIRFGGALQSIISFYDWGDQLHKVWIDK